MSGKSAAASSEIQQLEDRIPRGLSGCVVVAVLALVALLPGMKQTLYCRLLVEVTSGALKDS